MIPQHDIRPSSPSTRWTDEQVEYGVATLLRIGVMIAASITLAGGLLYLAAHGAGIVDYTTFRAPSPEVHTIGGILSGVKMMDSRALIQMGLLVLIATPVARVVLSLVGFIQQRDRMYIVITAIVLGILLFSLSGLLVLKH